MATLKCKLCGNELLPGAADTTCECEKCGANQTVPLADIPSKIDLFVFANDFLARGDFANATNTFNSIKNIFPNEAEAYWGLLLCKYEVAYAKDAAGKTILKPGKEIPVEIMEDPDFEKVLECASDEARPLYVTEIMDMQLSQVAAAEAAAEEAAPKKEPLPGAIVPAKKGGIGKKLEAEEVIKFGSYRGEEIEWQTLKTEEGKALLISKYALEVCSYSEGDSSDWKDSSLRKWLNEDFLKEAFTSEEQAIIETAKLSVEDAPEKDTEDKVFLLSTSEAENLFKNYKTRLCKTTKNANFKKLRTADSSEYCWWWLRASGENGVKAAFVSSGGFIVTRKYNIGSGKFAVRPCIWVRA